MLHESLAAVRLRPGMYVGDPGELGVRICAFEAIANAVDEFLAGRATRIDVVLPAEGGFVVTDDGGGIRPGVDVARALTTIHTTPSFDGHLPHRHVHNLGGLGLGTLSALAEHLTVSSVHPQRQVHVAARHGELLPGTGEPDGPTRGTRVRFAPDATLFTTAVVDALSVRALLRGLGAMLPGLALSLNGEALLLPRGMAELVADWNAAALAPPFEFRGQFEGTHIDVAAVWTREPGPQDVVRTFANLQATLEGSHLQGFRDAVLAALERQPQLAGLGRDALRKGLASRLALALAIDREALDYAGPTRGTVQMPEVRDLVARALTEPLARYFAGAGAPVVGAVR